MFAITLRVPQSCPAPCRLGRAKLLIVRVLLLLFVAAAALLGDVFKLYLKDGGFHVVREYQVQEDRVRYFSTERGEWEEIPKELVDLEKTAQERNAKNEKASKSAREQDEEEKAERALAKEIAAIPMESGAYYKPEAAVRALQIADYQVNTDKKRRVVQMVSPLPLVPGKATVVIKGEHSSFAISDKRPEFYLRLAKQEKFGIVRLTPNKKGFRIVENISIVPVSRENVESRKQMETFEQELMGNLYKVWPEKPLEPGEYALMEYSESIDQADLQLMIWDFAIQ